MQLLAVNHHYLRADKPGRGIYPLTEKEFRDRLSLLGSEYRLGSQAVVEEYAGGKALEGNWAVITFDDGLREQLKAIEVLEQFGGKPIFFVPTQPLVDRVVLDVHKLQMIRSIKDDEEVWGRLETEYGSLLKDVDDEAASSQYRYDSGDAARLKYALNFVLEAEVRGEWLKVTIQHL